MNKHQQFALDNALSRASTALDKSHFIARPGGWAVALSVNK